MTTSIRNPRPESKSDARGRKPTTEFEALWREPERTLVDYVAAVWSRKLWVGVAAGVMATIAFVYALTRANVYASQASLLVIGNRSGASAAEVAANMLRMGNIGPSQVLSALEVVNSSEVAERVVAKLTPAEITRPYQPERAGEEERQKMGLVNSAIDWMHRMQASWFQSSQTEASLRPEVATEVFRRSFTAWADERANMIKLVYRAGSRTQAQRILNDVVQVAIERYREVCAPEKSREWVLQRSAQAEQAYSKAKAEYDQFLALHGRAQFTEEMAARERTHAVSDAALDTARRTRDTTKENLEKWVARLGELEPQRKRTRDVVDDNSAARNDLILEQVRIENQKIGYEEGNTDRESGVYKSYVQQLKNIQVRMAALDVPRSATFIDDNPEFLQVEARIRELTFTRTELDNEIPRLEAEVAQQANDLKTVYALQERADRLVETYERAKTEVERLRDSKDAYEFSAQLDALGLTSLQLLDHPTVPLEKEGPQRARIILAGLGAGLLLSLTLIMLLVRMSKTFLRTSEVAVCLGRGDVVGMPWLERGNVRRFRLARKRGWD